MRRLLLIVLAVSLGAGLVAACGGGDGGESPFEGTWRVPAYGVTVTISGDTWRIEGLGSGSFSYEGVHPDYDVTLTFQGEQLAGTAHFIDADQLLACIGTDCALLTRS